ncbi:hypothetical protein Htur_2730 [Haloterrigena turkmenica DSM 5511]|uniref:Uncharacterized protein n=1 Tax=Haloterrigena turkmenica (strain ATCC 51198 / DSM 5511 / JCM 9101 / NCIMB 13204 / VKM B-1734 / 4k) TaxID=543526 RepID=D2RWV2_HALTV|nr:hypothetical protein [Haloterrigena turkmenica]ADB61603.1 hypothetical protein Htur_2730 [Haloterrigena turkmenica DSM 5511]
MDQLTAHRLKLAVGIAILVGGVLWIAIGGRTTKNTFVVICGVGTLVEEQYRWNKTGS